MASFQDKFKGKKALIFGLGLNDGGVGMAEFLVSQGAEVTITDGKSAKELKPSLEKLAKYPDIRYTLEKHIKEDFLENDLIIRNPAIKPGNKWLELAKENDKQIEMEMSLFHKLVPCPTVGVTGTKGKSTTTTLIHLFLQKFKETEEGEALLAGNIGKSAMRELPGLEKTDLAVLELSSYQLDAMGRSEVSPDVAVITNIFQDHINWHGSLQEYIEAKKNIFKYQKPGDSAVLNIDNEFLMKSMDEVNENLITCSLKDETADYYIDEVGILFENGVKLLNTDISPLEGEHNKYNICTAVAAARVFDVPVEILEKVLGEFDGVEFRQEAVGEINGIHFVNDTTATTTEAVIAALHRFGKDYSGRIVMISGGVDKDLDYSVIAELMERHLKSLILLEGSASQKINKALEKSDLDIESFYGDFENAIRKAYEKGDEGDLIILCPGAASFNMFVNEFDRGKQFNENFIKLKEEFNE